MVILTIVSLLGAVALAAAVAEARKQQANGAGIGRTVAHAAFSPVLFTIALIIGNAINPGVL
jgi:hypothetical protein